MAKHTEFRIIMILGSVKYNMYKERERERNINLIEIPLDFMFIHSNDLPSYRPSCNVHHLKKTLLGLKMLMVLEFFFSISLLLI